MLNAVQIHYLINFNEEKIIFKQKFKKYKCLDLINYLVCLQIALKGTYTLLRVVSKPYMANPAYESIILSVTG